VKSNLNSGSQGGDGSVRNSNKFTKAKEDSRKNFFNPTNDILPPSSKKGKSKEGFFKMRMENSP